MRIEPRWLDAEATADYISVRPNALMRLVRQGRLPQPCYPLGPRQPRWDRLALDARFEGGKDSTDINQVAEAIAQEIMEGPSRGSRRLKRSAPHVQKLGK